MARKVNVIAIRLGESVWWPTRTPPRRGRDETQKIIMRVVKGVMQKYGYLTSEVMVQRSVEGAGTITMIGTMEKQKAGGEGKRRRGQETEWKARSTIELYIAKYLEELIRLYENREYVVSYREGTKEYKNAQQLWEYIVRSEKVIIKMMRHVKRKVRKDMVRKPRAGRKVKKVESRG